MSYPEGPQRLKVKESYLINLITNHICDELDADRWCPELRAALILAEMKVLNCLSNDRVEWDYPGYNDEETSQDEEQSAEEKSAKPVQQGLPL